MQKSQSTPKGPASQRLGVQVDPDVLAAKWQQLRGDFKQSWGKFTDDEVMQMKGNYDQIVGRLKEKYQYNVEEAKTKFNQFLEAAKDKLR